MKLAYQQMKQSILMEPLDTASNLQEIPGTEEHVELHNECAVRKIQTVGNSSALMIWKLQQVNH